MAIFLLIFVINIVIDKAIPFGENLFSHIGQVTLINGRQIKADSIRHADALIVRSITPVDASLLNGSRVSFVASATSGIDHVDLSFLDKNGIKFAYAPGCNARSVAEYVLSACCALAGKKKFKLTDKTIGIIGCGYVGAQIRDFFKTLGMKYIVNDPPLRDKTGDEQYRDLSEIFSADIISLHVPLSKEGGCPTWRMITTDFLEKLKHDAILINTSRGEVINEADLLAFLIRNNQASAVLDVWANEPEINPALLARADIGTPHIAGYSLDSKLRATESVFHQACEFFDIRTGGLKMTVEDTPAEKTIILDKEMDETEAVRSAVLAAYDIQADDLACRRLLASGGEQRGGLFDELRNHYRGRREFTTMRISSPHRDNILCSKLKGLGFRTV